MTKTIRPNEFPDALFYLVRCDSFSTTERICSETGDLTAEEAFLHAIMFFENEHYEDVSIGDQITVQGPYSVATGAVRTFDVTQADLDASREL